MTVSIPSNDGQVYHWTQTETQVSITLQVPGDYSASDASIKFLADALQISLSSSQSSADVSGTLFEKVKPTDCIWQIESDEGSDTKTITAHLEKVKPSQWPILIKGGNMDPQSMYDLGNYYQAGEDPKKAVDLYI